MYKITLYDRNCCPVSDGTTCWFVDDLKKFEKKWLPLQAQYDVETIERYYRSKFGEVTTDYYSDDEKLNIVQKIEGKILGEKTFSYNNKLTELTNAYGCSTKVLFDKLQITLRIISFENRYLLVGQYFGCGCRRIEKMWNRWYDKETQYCQMNFYGNPIAIYTARSIDWDDMEKMDAHKDFYTNDRDFYKHEQIKTFVWLPIKEVEKNTEISELSDEEISLLLIIAKTTSFTGGCRRAVGFTARPLFFNKQ